VAGAPAVAQQVDVQLELLAGRGEREHFIVLALVCYYALSPLWGNAANRPDFAAAQGLVPVAILSLLLVAAQAVTAITSERDTGALDLLLVTDLTPKEFIFGKLWGILYNTKEYLLPPLVLTLAYAIFGVLATPPARHPELLVAKNGEAFAYIALATVVVLAFALWRTARGADWRVAAGWTTLALLLSTAWLLPWYVTWALPLAAVGGDRRLRAATLVFCAYAVLIHLPLADPLLSPKGAQRHPAAVAVGGRNSIDLTRFEVPGHAAVDLRW